MTSIKSKHERKNCPRCGAGFECRVGDVLRCQCSEVQLSEAADEFLSKTHYDCLCKNCLAEINRLVSRAQRHPFPTRPEMLQEGIHYYRENGRWVFTEFYHVLRGYCCGSGCRHCAYGYEK